MSTHRIETLRVELGHRSARSASGGQELHRRLMSFLRRDGLAAIEACFEDACPPGEVWILPGSRWTWARWTGTRARRNGRSVSPRHCGASSLARRAAHRPAPQAAAWRRTAMSIPRSRSGARARTGMRSSSSFTICATVSCPGA